MNWMHAAEEERFARRPQISRVSCDLDTTLCSILVFVQHQEWPGAGRVRQPGRGDAAVPERKSLDVRNAFPKPSPPEVSARCWAAFHFWTPGACKFQRSMHHG